MRIYIWDMYQLYSSVDMRQLALILCSSKTVLCSDTVKRGVSVPSSMDQRALMEYTVIL